MQFNRLEFKSKINDDDLQVLMSYPHACESFLEARNNCKNRYERFKSKAITDLVTAMKDLPCEKLNNLQIDFKEQLETVLSKFIDVEFKCYHKMLEHAKSLRTKAEEAEQAELNKIIETAAERQEQVAQTIVDSINMRHHFH